MLVKQFSLPAYDAYGEPTCRTIYCPLTRQDNIEKTASLENLSPEVIEFISNLKIEPGHTYKLLTALGASEYWGQNRNGDIFYEYCLLFGGPKYGYQSFSNAGLYRHHQNKDPSKSLGKVILAHYNPVMHRVELILDYDHEKLKKFDALDYLTLEHPDYSMACVVPFDRCSVCNDEETYLKALSTAKSQKPDDLIEAVLNWIKERGPIRGIRRNQLESCEHIRTMKNRILDSGNKKGVQVGMINEFPRFHDISQVNVGAAPEAKEMVNINKLKGRDGHEKKSFYIYTPSNFSGFLQKAAALNVETIPFALEHQAEIYKKLRSRGVATAEQFEDDLPKGILLFGNPIETAKGLAVHGIILKPHEFQYLLLAKSGRGSEAAALKYQKKIFPHGEEINQEFYEEFVEAKPKKIVGKDVLRKRSCFEPFVELRLADYFLDKKASINSDFSYFDNYEIYDSDLMRELGNLYLTYRKAISDNFRFLVKEAQNNGIIFDGLNNLFLAGNLSGDLSDAYVKTAYLRLEEFDKI